MKVLNRSIVLASRPKGVPTLENFRLVKKSIPTILPGEVLVKSIYLSVDPYMRGRMRGKKTYVSPFELDEVITGGVVGKIIASRNSEFLPGDIVEGRLGWSDYNVTHGKHIRKIDPTVAPITTALGAAGMPGLTAYFGMLDIGKPKAGETVVISGAAGAVGSVAGQIAKMKGCRVVGIAGTDKKIDYLLRDLNFDAAIHYKQENVYEKLKEACPSGVDVYFDNVGDDISDQVMRLINFQARIVLCGAISAYNSEKVEFGPRLQGLLIQKSALMQGFIVGDYKERYHEGYAQLIDWIKQGKLKFCETVTVGLENTPKAFIGLFHGDNIGKQLVKVDEG